MYRSALRSSPRITNSLRPANVAIRIGGRRCASTVPADRRRSWKSSAARWGLAIGAVYWYNTNPAFAEEPQLTTIPAPPQFSDDDLPTVEAVVAQKRKEAEARTQKKTTSSTPTPQPASSLASASQSPATPAQDVDTSADATPAVAGSPEELEAEADQQGAFNPETGEINWECPCLGGMAHGPCGEQFRAAFSCFVYSTEEPKGMDCIEKFQHMQDCFRLHPDIYGEELEGDEEEAAAAAAGPADSTAEGGVEAAAAKTTASTETTATPAPETPTESPTHTATTRTEGWETVSYAAVAASGPRQTPEEAAAPQQPEIVSSESTSTSSLIDVDTPSVRTVPSDFMEQDVQTDTQAARRDLEDAADRARAEADLAKKKTSKKARKADNVLTKWFGELGDGVSTALVISNLAAVIGLSTYGGYKAWGLYERGRLGWKHVGIGAGVALGVGLIESFLGGYLYKGKKSKQS